MSSRTFLKRKPFPFRVQDATQSTTQPGHSTRHIAAPPPPPELSLVAFRDNIHLSFMFFNYLWRSNGALWLDHAAVGKFGSLSLNATYALSQVNFGTSNHQADITLQGMTLHGRCLKELATRLVHVDKGSRDLIVPILVLLAYAVSHLLDMRCSLGSSLIKQRLHRAIGKVQILIWED